MTVETIKLRLTLEALAGPLGAVERRDLLDALPTGCWHCLRRLAGKTSSPCPSHGDEWEVGR